MRRGCFAEVERRSASVQDAAAVETGPDPRLYGGTRRWRPRCRGGWLTAILSDGQTSLNRSEQQQKRRRKPLRLKLAVVRPQGRETRPGRWMKRQHRHSAMEPRIL